MVALIPLRWYDGIMKIKTSITISSELLAELDKVVSEGLRSEFMEKAAWKYLELLNREMRNRRDLQILNADSENLNAEALDALSYQA